MAVVDRGVLNIDAYHTNTIDKAFFNGHYYSDKAIGTSLFGVPIYWMAKTFYRFFQLPLDYFEADYWVRLGVISLPSALLAVLFYRFLSFFTADESRLWLTLAYGLGTLAFPYSTLFFGHQLSAIFALSKKRTETGILPLGAHRNIFLFDECLLRCVVGRECLWTSASRPHAALYDLAYHLLSGGENESCTTELSFHSRGIGATDVSRSGE